MELPMFRRPQIRNAKELVRRLHIRAMGRSSKLRTLQPTLSMCPKLCLVRIGSISRQYLVGAGGEGAQMSPYYALNKAVFRAFLGSLPLPSLPPPAPMNTGTLHQRGLKSISCPTRVQGAPAASVAIPAGQCLAPARFPRVEVDGTSPLRSYEKTLTRKRGENKIPVQTKVIRPKWRGCAIYYGARNLSSPPKARTSKSASLSV